MYAEQMKNPFKVKNKSGTQEGVENDYLIQDISGEQWCMPPDVFNVTYEPAILSNHSFILNGILNASDEIISNPK